MEKNYIEPSATLSYFSRSYNRDQSALHGLNRSSACSRWSYTTLPTTIVSEIAPPTLAGRSLFRHHRTNGRYPAIAHCTDGLHIPIYTTVFQVHDRQIHQLVRNLGISGGCSLRSSFCSGQLRHRGILVQHDIPLGYNQIPRDHIPVAFDAFAMPAHDPSRILRIHDHRNHI